MSLLKNLHRDDCWNSSLTNYPLILAVNARDALAHPIVKYHPVLIPNQPSDVFFIPEDAAPSLTVTVDGGGVPLRATRRRDFILVQPIRNLTGCLSADELVEDTTDGLRLRLIDLQLPRMEDIFCKFRYMVPKGPSAHALTNSSFRLHAALHHLGGLFSLHLGDKTLDADLDSIHPASTIHGPNLNAVEFQPVGDKVHVAHRAGQAAQGLDDQILELLPLSRLH
nr:hypothetical protein [Microvirga aerophila]